jgi:hypothetical protein
MAAVIVGMFEAEKQAAQAVRKLLHSCVPSDHVRTVVATPRRPFGPAFRRSRGPRREQQSAGIMVAVKTADHVSQQLAVSVLRAHGARDIERTAFKPESSVPAGKSGDELPSVQYPLPL